MAAGMESNTHSNNALWNPNRKWDTAEDGEDRT